MINYKCNFKKPVCPNYEIEKKNELIKFILIYNACVQPHWNNAPQTHLHTHLLGFC